MPLTKAPLRLFPDATFPSDRVRTRPSPSVRMVLLTTPFLSESSISTPCKAAIVQSSTQQPEVWFILTPIPLPWMWQPRTRLSGAKISIPAGELMLQLAIVLLLPSELTAAFSPDMVQRTIRQSPESRLKEASLLLVLILRSYISHPGALMLSGPSMETPSCP